MPVFLLLLGYLSGSVPWGALLARRAGIDVRRSGSGSIGAANVARTAGVGLGALTLLADALKGALPVLVAGSLTTDTWTPAGTGLTAFAGHVYPPTRGVAGGKGVATALGVLAVLCPTALACAFAVFVLLFSLWRYVSVASTGAALTAPAAVWVLGYPAPTLAASLVMAALIPLRHRENFRRLRAGTEPRFTVHKKQAPLRQ